MSPPAERISTADRAGPRGTPAAPDPHAARLDRKGRCRRGGIVALGDQRVERDRDGRVPGLTSTIRGRAGSPAIAGKTTHRGRTDPTRRRSPRRRCRHPRSGALATNEPSPARRHRPTTGPRTSPDRASPSRRVLARLGRAPGGHRRLGPRARSRRNRPVPLPGHQRSSVDCPAPPPTGRNVRSIRSTTLRSRSGSRRRG